MILTDNRFTIDYFEKLPTDIKRITVAASGGLDSSLILYCLAKTLNDRRQYDTTIFIHHDIVLKYKHTRSQRILKQVLLFIREKFPNVNIEEPYYGHQPTFIKSKMIYGAFSLLITHLRTRSQLTIIGYTKQDDETHKGLKKWLHRLVIKIRPQQFPFKDVDKHFVKAQYDQLGLHELSLMTGTCVEDVYGGMPCRKCKWCKIRYEAFGTYDYGYV